MSGRAIFLSAPILAGCCQCLLTTCGQNEPTFTSAAPAVSAAVTAVFAPLSQREATR